MAHTVIPDEAWNSDTIVFVPRDAGDARIIKGFHARGTMKGWQDTVGLMRPYPRAMLAIDAALAAPLLEILQVPNFGVDWSNRTSTGKTTVLRGAASVWGDTDERSGTPLIFTWDVTPVWVERAAAVINSMPLILDDTKRARDPKKVAEIIYLFCSGQGRGRGNLVSVAETATWHTILLSSGEAPATSFTNDGGTRTRILSIRGNVFGTVTPGSRSLVDSLNQGFLANYGHAGPEFVRWLLRNRDRWDELRAAVVKGADHYAKKAPTAEGGRLAKYASVIAVAARIAHEAGILPWPYADPIAPLWEQIANEAAEASGEVRALQDVISWCHSNKEAFFGRHVEDKFNEARAPHGGWAGRWDKGDDWQFIAFLPNRLKTLLTEWGYSSEAIVSGWLERGWLRHETSKRDQKVRVDGAATRCVTIKRSAVDEVEGGGECIEDKN